MKKHIKVLDVEQYGRDDFEFEGSLDDLIIALLQHRRSIPQEHRKSATYQIDSTARYESSYASFRIDYSREETDSERLAREQTEQARNNEQAEKRRAEYERLKREFE